MPSLDRLQADLGSERFQVVTLSMDRAGVRPVLRFFEDLRIANLPSYIDESGETVHDLGATGLPTSLLIDPQDREVARLIGPAEWDNPDVVAFLKARIAAPSTQVILPPQGALEEPSASGTRLGP
jgi:hypothetical protein